MGTLKRGCCATVLFAFVATLGGAAPALAQAPTNTRALEPTEGILTNLSEQPPADQPLALDVLPAEQIVTPLVLLPEPAAWKSLFTQNVPGMMSRDTVRLLGLGAIFAAAAFPNDNEVTREMSTKTLSAPARPGAVVGSTPFQIGGAFLLYGIGKLTDKPRLAHVGGDLMRAQIFAEVMTVGIKHAVRRHRPDGSTGSYSFPSGHTAVSFSSATVIQRHFGWKFGIPAYGVAGYVALSRVQMKRHYLSDVAFGAAIGILAGRTVTMGHGRKLELMPTATPGGATMSFRWIGQK